MELDELVHGKLLGFKSWFISKASDGSEAEKKWSAAWLRGDIDPPSDRILFNIDFSEETSFFDQIEKISKVQKPSFFLHLTLYQSILEDYLRQEYVAALERIFTLQFLIGKEEGKREEKRQNILRNADWINRPKQDAALSYYKKFSLHELKYARAAADEIDSKANIKKLSYETIYDYVRFYRKKIRLINSEMPKLESGILNVLSESVEITVEEKKLLSDQIERMRLEEINKLGFVSVKAVKR